MFRRILFLFGLLLAFSTIPTNTHAQTITAVTPVVVQAADTGGLGIADDTGAVVSSTSSDVSTTQGKHTWLRIGLILLAISAVGFLVWRRYLQKSRANRQSSPSSSTAGGGSGDFGGSDSSSKSGPRKPENQF